jgi:hypothetical protein
MVVRFGPFKLQTTAFGESMHKHVLKTLHRVTNKNVETMEQQMAKHMARQLSFALEEALGLTSKTTTQTNKKTDQMHNNKQTKQFNTTNATPNWTQRHNRNCKERRRNKKNNALRTTKRTTNGCQAHWMASTHSTHGTRCTQTIDSFPPLKLNKQTTKKRSWNSVG